MDENPHGNSDEDQREPPHDAIAAAEAYGIDLSITFALLELTPAERLRRHEQALELVRAARAAGIRHYGFDPRMYSPNEPAHGPSLMD